MEKRARQDGGVNDTLPSTSYVSRVLPLAIGVAEQVFDTCCGDRQFRSPVPTRWSVAAGPVHLLQLQAPVRAVPASRISASRLCRGELRAGRLRGRFAIELELSPWSRTESELGLRLLGRHRMPDRYIDAANAVVDALASELELRGLLALHPAHTTGTTRQEVAASAWL